MLTVRGRYLDGRVILLEPVPLEGTRDVLITFLDSGGLVVVPEETYEQAARAASLKASTLSERELEVLRVLQQGLTNREIALKLEISVGTVRNHTSSIYRKLGARNRLEAVALASEQDLI